MYWVKRKRKIYSEHLKKEIEDESIYYGLLVIVVCDENGIGFHPASYHEVRSLRIKHKMSEPNILSCVFSSALLLTTMIDLW